MTIAPSTTKPELAPSELRYLVLAAQREGNRALNRMLGGYGLTASQFEILLVLSQSGPLTLKDLGGLIVCETGSPSRIVDTLVSRHFVERKVSVSDRRAVTLKLTPAGAALIPMLQQIDKSMGALPDGSGVRPEDVAGLVSVLRKYIQGTSSEEVLERRFATERQPLPE